MKKLSLAKETLAALTQDQAPLVAGGLYTDANYTGCTVTLAAYGCGGDGGGTAPLHTQDRICRFTGTQTLNAVCVG